MAAGAGHVGYFEPSKVARPRGDRTGACLIDLVDIRLHPGLLGRVRPPSRRPRYFSSVYLPTILPTALRGP